MQWEQRSYLKLCISHGVAIDTTHYPGGTVRSLRNATKADLQTIITNWGNSSIAWFKLTPEQIKLRKEEYQSLQRGDNGSEDEEEEDPNEKIPTPKLYVLILIAHSVH